MRDIADACEVKADVGGASEVLSRNGESIFACVEQMKMAGATITDKRSQPQQGETINFHYTR
jgi:hypothetical protein